MATRNEINEAYRLIDTLPDEDASKIKQALLKQSSAERRDSYEQGKNNGYREGYDAGYYVAMMDMERIEK